MLPNYTLPTFQIIPSEYPQALSSILEEHNKKLSTLLKQSVFSWQNLMAPLDAMHLELENFWSPFAHMHAVLQTPELRTNYEKSLTLLIAHESEWAQHTELFAAMSTIPQDELSATQNKILKDQLRNFRLAGVHLPPKEKNHVKAIEERLSELQTQFENNLMDAELAYELVINDEKNMQGLPEHTLAQARQRAQTKQTQGYILGIDQPTYQAVMMYAENRSIREKIYHAYQTRASEIGPQAGKFDNGPIMREIMQLRHELSQLLGFEHYAALSLETKMAHDVDSVNKFITSLIARVRPQAQKELQELEKFAQEKLNITTLQPWDIGFISEKLKEHKFSFSEEALRPYFKASSVWSNIHLILQRLYGIKLVKIDNAQTWHDDVQCLSLIDSEQKTIGYLYVDLFARPNKRSGAWMDSLQTRCQLATNFKQLPIATLTCNFAPPIDTQEPCYLHDELVTLLHELGHCLHHLLTKVDDYSASGIHGVEWDAVELPSQFFEHWAWDKEMLKQFTYDKNSNTHLPEQDIQQLLATKTFLTGLSLLRQLEFSWFDLQIHQHKPGENTTWMHEIINKIRKTTNLISLPEYNRFENGFSHIFAGGYAAGYYSYLWAEVLSSDCFSMFEKNGLFDLNTSTAFLGQILSTGSSRTAKENFEKFMGREPTQDAFLRHRGIQNTINNHEH